MVLFSLSMADTVPLTFTTPASDTAGIFCVEAPGLWAQAGSAKIAQAITAAANLVMNAPPLSRVARCRKGIPRGGATPNGTKVLCDEPPGSCHSDRPDARY
jgi:hypothetical protein